MTAATKDTPPSRGGWFRPGGNVWHRYHWDNARRAWFSRCPADHILRSGYLLKPYRDDDVRTCSSCLTAVVMRPLP